LHHGTNRPVMVRIVHGTNSPGGYEQFRVTDFKFDIYVPRDTSDVTPLKFSEKRAWPGKHDSLNFGSKMLIAPIYGLQISETRSLVRQ